ncbi:MAG: type I DNA topoisomerase, partial [Bdellovibrionales bacterium]|nr:type I DNA topoisomerase [Bdellovibrionales bacterium]
MSAQNLVIVESPAKAKTINKYLGSDYMVVASFGHVRDLPAKNGSVDPEKDFAMQWEIGDRSHKPLGEIISRAKKVQNVFLATDPDREGEAISWHVSEYLKEKYLADKVKIRRVTFNEITKSAIQEAFKHARDIDHHLVDAYMARRALDYLVGFTLSPVLWRKLPGSRSAGRVQSVALRLICEREAEIEIFKPEEYWSIETTMTTKEGKSFTARLSQLDGDKIEKMTIGNQGSADAAVARITGQNFHVASIERKQVRRNPYPPFITSTLQQEASRKLRFSATKTMRTAQRLYEGVDIGGETVGLITYMRTDGITLSGEAIAASRQLIKNKFGESYLPESPRAYKSKVKNAQEAHEAIRPTDVHRTPDSVSEYLGEDEAKLYDLIWKRTVACQMESAVLDQVAVDIANADGKVVLRATGSIIAFDGFLKVYREEQEDEDKDAS